MWIRPKITLAHEDPGDLHGFCGGKDKLLGEKCSCPDPLYLLELRALTGEVLTRKFSCACCSLPFDKTFRP